MIRNNISKLYSGFTLIEVLIASSLLAALAIVAYNMFSGSLDSFNAGSWRVLAQKQAQLLLNTLKGYIEKANYAQMISPGGLVASEAQPLVLTNAFSEKQGDCLASLLPILFFSITEPYIAADTSLGNPERKGKWSGVSLRAEKGKLILKRTSSWAKHDSAFDAPPETHPTDAAKFNDGTPGKDSVIVLEDVVDFGLYVQNAAGTNATSTTVDIVVNLSRLKNGQPTVTKISERIRANLLDRSHTVKIQP